MAARPLSLTKSPLNKSPLSKSPLSKSPKKTLGKGGSQMSIPRLTGDGIIMAGELYYFHQILRNEPTHDFTEDDYQITYSQSHYLVYGLMIYHLLVSKNEREIMVIGDRYHIDVSEFEDDLDYGEWEDYPKEFIIYVFRKIAGQVADVDLSEEFFDETISDLVENGYLTYSQNPFIGYFTPYKILNYDYVNNNLPENSDIMRMRGDTALDGENGFIICNLGIFGEIEEDSNFSWDEIVNRLSFLVGADIGEVEMTTIAGGDRENPEYLGAINRRDYTLDIVKNLERIIRRMIDTKYIKYQGRVAYKIELESEKF